MIYLIHTCLTFRSVEETCKKKNMLLFLIQLKRVSTFKDLIERITHLEQIITWIREAVYTRESNTRVSTQIFFIYKFIDKHLIVPGAHCERFVQLPNDRYSHSSGLNRKPSSAFSRGPKSFTTPETCSEEHRTPVSLVSVSITHLVKLCIALKKNQFVFINISSTLHSYTFC